MALALRSRNRSMGQNREWRNRKNPTKCETMSQSLKSCTSGPATSALIWVPLAWASQVAPMVKNMPARKISMPAGNLRHVWSLGQEDPLEEEMTTHSSILAWRIPRTEEPGGLQSIGLQRVGHDWSNLAQHSPFFNNSPQKTSSSLCTGVMSHFFYIFKQLLVSKRVSIKTWNMHLVITEKEL